MSPFHASIEAEREAVAKSIGEAVEAGIAPEEIGVFVRSAAELPRAQAAVTSSGQEVLHLFEHDNLRRSGVTAGTMHLGKGFEFKAVAVMACDDEILPMQTRVESVADEVDLDDVYETERQLLYVACTRARDRLRVGSYVIGSIGDPERIRTSDPQIRNLMLYPAELRGRAACAYSQ